jgi:Holliday junction resolvase RusA-like endonuclease
MGKSYQAYREKFSAVAKETMKDFPLSEKVSVMLCSYGMKIIRVTEIWPVNKRDLGTRENFSSHMNEM